MFKIQDHDDELPGETIENKDGGDFTVTTEMFWLGPKIERKPGERRFSSEHLFASYDHYQIISTNNISRFGDSKATKHEVNALKLHKSVCEHELWQSIGKPLLQVR